MRLFSLSFPLLLPWLLALPLLACDEQEEALRRKLAQAERALSEAKAALTSSSEAASAERALRESAGGPLELDIQFMCGNRPLDLAAPCDLPFASMRFEWVRYWLSNLELIDESGAAVLLPNSYYLMEARMEDVPAEPEDPSSEIVQKPKKREAVQLPVAPAGRYSKLAFHLGVDPEHNGDLSLPGGELNVFSRMAFAGWMWFTSYIFTSVSAELILRDRVFSLNPFFLGWETGADDDYRRVEITLPAPIEVGLERTPKIELTLEVGKLFEGLEAKIKEDFDRGEEWPVSSINAPTPDARTQLMNNWQAAFQLRAASAP